jgi:sigma-B regulation protein RsbU (phosphoserine phosphatase)
MAGSENISLGPGSEDTSTSLKGVYIAGALAIAIGIVVDFLLNIITPLNLSLYGFSGIAASLSQNLGQRVIYLICIILISWIILYVILSLILRPVTKSLMHRKRFQEPPFGESERAGNRLLNLPFYFIAVSLGIWILLPACIFFVAYLRQMLDSQSAVIFFLRATFVGFIASFIGFYAIEHQLRRGLIPYFFPQGRLSERRGVASLSISRRIRMLFRLGSMVPVIILIVTLMMTQWELTATPVAADAYGRGIISFIIVLFGLFFFTTGILNRSVSRSITLPLNEIARVLKNVRFGRFDRKVQVVSNDEVGYVGDVINEMIDGLVERDQMRQSLELAKEVQQNLLPQNSLIFGNIHVAGKSIYCDETGGDYFDFIPLDLRENTKIGIAIGDVAGHGIPSALLMATARSSLRQRSAIPGDIGQIVTDVNRQLVRDVEESGQFMTLFYLIADARNKSLQWVRAGHEPAVFYDPLNNTFEELCGHGVGLGVVEDYAYEKNEKVRYQEGQIIFLGTDGIWEACNTHGEMFGKERIHKIIRENAALDADHILNAILKELSEFQGDARIEDDVTLVLVKL